MNDANRAALAAALARPAWQATRYELLPIAGMQEAAGALPEGAVVTVTCSPRHGLERTLEATEWLAGAGFRVVPHLAARLVRDRAHLERLLGRLAVVGVDDAFVVGGDAERPVGAYPHGRALLEAMAGLTQRPARLGVPAYPEGHHRIGAADLQHDLEAKAALADYAVTQLCFEARPLQAWRERQRRLGLSLPVHAGIPGVMEPRRLLAIALRLGLGPSVRSLRRRSGWVARLLRPADYRPEALVEELRPALGDLAGGFVGLHVYTFNRVEPTRRWLEGLQDRVPIRASADEPDAQAATPAGEPLA
ncbi:methylenetetrahydrofolate reductase [Halomonas ramblicola]|uniref:methylenetetrahydrofolate reductase n=1 Tax=Halomonas ramblicola TaxID=747349 RepID=UPI0025B46EAD|nr:methylenetetrahydrofolate reductase [Halomonas ramblicola]MDN3522434.1 methylenetetrahydrofolate reductase [Halomonas ramblicola]